MYSACESACTTDPRLRGIDFNKLVRKVNFNKVMTHPLGLLGPLGPLGPAGPLIFKPPSKPAPAPARTVSATAPTPLAPPTSAPSTPIYSSSTGSYDPLYGGAPAASELPPLPPPPIPPGLDPMDLWQRLITYYLQQRPVAQLEDGSALPVSSVGDVAQAALVIGRELVSSRYDGALLAPVRAGWSAAEADAMWRAQNQPWSAEYPDPAGFWYGSALAVAQALSSIYGRRNANVSLRDRVLVVTGEQRSDPLELWQDLRDFFLKRRGRHTGSSGSAYPLTTVADVVQVAEIFDDALKAAPPASYDLPARKRSWQTARSRVDQLAAGLERDSVYPENQRWWLDDTKRLALYLEAVHDAMDGFDDTIAAQVNRRHGGVL